MSEFKSNPTVEGIYSITNSADLVDAVNTMILICMDVDSLRKLQTAFESQAVRTTPQMDPRTIRFVCKSISVLTEEVTIKGQGLLKQRYK